MASNVLDASLRLAQGGSIRDFASSLAGLAQMRQSLVAAGQTFGADVSPNTSLRTGAPQAGHGLIAPATGKIIGTPFQGTHGKTFNAKGGSDNWESENAVDLSVPIGTPLRALSDGVIGSQFGSLGSGGRFAGLRLHIEMPGGNEAYYAHLSKFAPGIKPGVHVRKGQIIGYSGEANGVAHLHIALKSGNPLTLFGGG